MPNKRRAEHYARWNVARSADVAMFWEIIERLFEKREVRFSKEHLAVITHRNVAEFEDGKELDITTRHHIFVTAQWAVRKSRTKEQIQQYKNNDPEGIAMSSLRCRHEEVTGEVRPMLYWENIVKERFRLQKETGVRHKIKRHDASLGFDLKNLQVVKFKSP